MLWLLRMFLKREGFTLEQLSSICRTILVGETSNPMERSCNSVSDIKHLHKKKLEAYSTYEVHCFSQIAVEASYVYSRCLFFYRY